MLQQRSGRLSQAAAPPIKHGQPSHGRDGSSQAQIPLMQLPTQQSLSSLHESPGAMQSGLLHSSDSSRQTPGPPGSLPVGQQGPLPPQTTSSPVSQVQPNQGLAGSSQKQTPCELHVPWQQSSSMLQLPPGSEHSPVGLQPVD